MSANPKFEIPVLDAPVERMGGQLLEALVTELRVIGSSWQQLSKQQQDDVIGRLKQRIRYETERAIHLIAAGAFDAARVAVAKVTVKDGAKAEIVITDKLHEVIDYVGSPAVLVMCDPAQFFGGMDEVEGEADQRALNLDEDDDDPDATN